MRTSYALLFGVAAAGLGLIATAPGAAMAPQSAADALTQPESMPDPAPDPTSDPMPSEQRQAEIDSWPAEKQTAYSAWPAETKAYYWTLSDERRMMFWALADSDKIALTAMTGPERDAAWERIEEAAGTAPPAEA